MDSWRTWFRLARTWRETPLSGVLQALSYVCHHPASLWVVLGIALVLANASATAPLYEAGLEHRLRMEAGAFLLDGSLEHWVNEGLMVIVWIWVGLILKREMTTGLLALPGTALLPMAAGLGSAMLSALVYAVLTRHSAGAHGWGIPVATDMVLPLGILAFGHNYLSAPLKRFLLSVSVVNNLIAAGVIVVFYTTGVDRILLVLGCFSLGILVLANLVGIRALGLYLWGGIVVWYVFLPSGIHAAVAGILIGLTLPARYVVDDRTFATAMATLLEKFKATLPSGDSRTATRRLTDSYRSRLIQRMETLSEQVLTPLQRFLQMVRGPVQFLVVPLFVLTNAGISIPGNRLEAIDTTVMLGILGGVFIGKPFGLLAGTYLIVRTKMAKLPAGIGWHQLAVTGSVAGSGLVMPLYMAYAAFGTDSDLLSSARLAVLLTALLATGLSALYRRRVGHGTDAPPVA